MADHRRMHVLIGGRVQGVGFRFFVVREAEGRGLTGWVRNRREDQVEVLAEGPPAQLEDFLTALREGPPLAWVAGMTVEWQEATGEFRSFEPRASQW